LGSTHCSVGPSIDEGIVEKRAQLARAGVVVGDARAGGDADGAVDEIEVVDPVALQPRDVEAVEDAQRQQILESLAGWRQRMDRHAAIRGADRIQPRRLHRLEILLREAAAQLAGMGDDRLAERAAMQIRGSLRGDRLECARKFGLLQDLAGAHLALAEGIGAVPVLVEGRVILQLARRLHELALAELGQDDAVTRQRDRRPEHLGERLASIGPDQLAPAGEIARRTAGERSARQILALLEALDRQPGRHARDEV
jgi:hypothetical protein